ncbi:UNVERIFIED_CONTAM: hypothetical protein NY100_33540, partial [Prevotella sp. 15_C9]
VFDSNYSNLLSGGTPGTNWHMDILYGWTPVKKNTDVPRLQISTQILTQATDRFIIYGSYLSLNNLTLC